MTKVRVVLTVEIDKDAWEQAYGTKMTAAEFREEVRLVARDTVATAMFPDAPPSVEVAR